MIAKQIPTISPGVAGPLGVLHLPRLWQKASLGAVGKLHDAYTSAGGGFDQMVLDALGIKRTDFLAYIASHKPTYPQVERWIVEKCGGAIDPGAVAAFNTAVECYAHDGDTRSEILEDCGIDCGEDSLQDAVSLNNLDDWTVFYRQVIASGNTE